MQITFKVSFFILSVYILIFFSCTPQKISETNSQKIEDEQQKLFQLLEDPTLTNESLYAVINKIAENYLAAKMDTEVILFLSGYVEKHPEDTYNAYWLLMTGYAYMRNKAEPAAEYYFDRIIQNYNDLIVKGESVHILCLQNLIRISTNPANRIRYFQQLISRFPNKVNITELYVRLANEYEKLGDWEQALKTYALFLSRPDATTIQIPGMPEAYSTARKMIDFNNSPKDWTFESLEALESAVKTAIQRYSYAQLDKYKSKVNFFAMSWKQDDTDENSQGTFSMRDFGTGNRIRFSASLDESSNPNEAFLRTWGWSQYISVWYFYFRKVNFPVDPEIHGRWEWAGIYYGEKL